MSRIGKRPVAIPGGVTANIAFTPKGELTTPAVTLYVYKDGVRTPLN